ncbi:MAG: hypothetical protein HQK96_01690 [Nitrospirae bacterium]|nr:hypothetical protein [Nitrospirota bacterium]
MNTKYTNCPGCNKEIMEGDAVTCLTFSSDDIDIGYDRNKETIVAMNKPRPKKGEFFNILTYSLGIISVLVIPDDFLEQHPYDKFSEHHPNDDLAFVTCGDACAAKVQREYLESELNTH